MLKTWFYKHLNKIQNQFKNDFEDFLWYIIKQSQCDKFIRKHFKHSVNEEYLFENEYEMYQCKLLNYEIDEKNKKTNLVKNAIKLYIKCWLNKLLKNELKYC